MKRVEEDKVSVSIEEFENKGILYSFDAIIIYRTFIEIGDWETPTFSEREVEDFQLASEIYGYNWETGEEVTPTENEVAVILALIDWEHELEKAL